MSATPPHSAPATLPEAIARIRELEQENERLRKELLKLRQTQAARGDHASSRLRDALRE
jgi:ribosomal protein L29